MNSILSCDDKIPLPSPFTKNWDPLDDHWDIGKDSFSSGSEFTPAEEFTPTILQDEKNDHGSNIILGNETQ